nr:zinc-dependent alcohol dehydrogenase family protein [Nodosilinea nodulosa]
MPKIVRFYEYGGAEVLQIHEEALRAPGPGEVRLAVEAFGLNRSEVSFREGKYLEQPDQLPSTLGYEASGVVDAVGAGVTEVSVGDRVSTIPAFSMKQYGVYGESAIVPATAVAAYPNGLSAQQGTAIWMSYLTAYGALVEYGQIKAGDVVVITAASSSVGYSAIQIVKAAGAVAIATTRGRAKRQTLLDHGADYVIVTEEEDLADRVMAISGGRGANLIFDAVAGPLLKTLAKAAAPGATIFVYGALGPEGGTPFPLFAALKKGLRVQGYTLFEITSNPVKLAPAKRYVYDGLAAGRLAPVIDRVFTLDQIVAAHRYMESNQQNGKIVVTVP